MTIDVPANGSWGSDCNLDQIFSQAGEETVRKVEGCLRQHLHVSAVIIKKEVTAIAAVSTDD